MKRRKLAITIALMGTTFVSYAATEADVDQAFNPYKNGAPNIQGLTPGTVINKTNLAQFEKYIDKGNAFAIKNGWYEIKVGKHSNFAPHASYIAETKKNLNKTKLGPKLGVRILVQIVH